MVEDVFDDFYFKQISKENTKQPFWLTRKFMTSQREYDVT